ncbi:MAG TPA: lipoate--protein ligase family protein [Verrucomicrobiae bacterium]|nr:lipoate--protein ligase family protein [Verrucomicrobiae bacterium]
MKYIDLTLPSPAANLACDEALLDHCEAGLEDELLRFWEPQEPFVVVGYANQASREVDLEACQANKIGVFRRCTGGGTVVQGPGILNYSLILRIPESGPLQSITGTNTHILQRHQSALAPLLKVPVHIQGHTDLAVQNLKFSGNAQRRKRKFLIFHGTFLLKADIPLIEKLLRMPSKQPDYRQNRTHRQFLMNLEMAPELLKSALRQAWQAHELFPDLPVEKIHGLAQQKYSTTEWNLKF